MKNIKKLLPTLSKICFHILPPVGLIVVVCDASIGQELWQEITRPHDLYWPIVCCCSNCRAGLSCIVWFSGFSNLATSWNDIRSRQKLWFPLPHSRTAPSNLCVALWEPGPCWWLFKPRSRLAKIYVMTASQSVKKVRFWHSVRQKWRDRTRQTINHTA